MKKILIISEYIAPVQAIGAIRWTKIMKYIKAYHDVEITVLTNEKNYDNPQSLLPTSKKDPLLQKDMGIFTNYWVVPTAPTLQRYYRLKKKATGSTSAYTIPQKRAMQALWKRKLKQDITNLANDYKNRCMAEAMWEYLQQKTINFDAVISSYGPVWTHLVAERIKQNNADTFWIADFRDPYAKEEDGYVAFHLHKKFAQKYCAAADVITRVNDRINIYPARNNQLKVVTNGYDLEEALTPVRPLRFSLVFTGALYGNRRDMGPAFRALKELISEGKINGGQTAIEYAGNDSEIARECAKRYRMENLLIDHGEIPREQALELQRKAAILLQLAWNTKKDNCAWSGKMYEYMMMKKPIAFIVTGDEPNSYPSRHMALLGGCCYEQCREEETYTHLKQYILDKYIEWQQTGNVSIQRDENYVKQYSYREIAEQVWKLIGKEQ